MNREYSDTMYGNGYWLDIDEEIKNNDITPYLEAEYIPSQEELQGGLEMMSDAGRFWRYDKIICFWGTIGSNELQSCLDDLSEQTGFDFSDYRIVYYGDEDESASSIKCVSVEEYIHGNQEHVDDTAHKDGEINHLGRPEDKWRATMKFRQNRGELQGKKLGNMTMAQYNALKHPYGESIRRVNKIISENINRFLINEGLIKTFDGIEKKLSQMGGTDAKGEYYNYSPSTQVIYSFDRDNFDEVKIKKLTQLYGYHIDTIDKSGDNITIFLEPLHEEMLKKYERPDFLYHVTQKKYLDKIMRIGLQPKSTNLTTWDETDDDLHRPERIYFFEDFESAEGYSNSRTDIILKVDVSKIQNIPLYADRFMDSDGGGLYTTSPISPTAISIADND